MTTTAPAPADPNRPSARLGAGNIEITLVKLPASDNTDPEMEAITLKPSYHASRGISGLAGGLLPAMERIARLEVEFIASVIAFGMGYGTQNRRAPGDLPERVYRTGLSDNTGGLAERCIAYVRVLMNGGQAQDEEARDDTADPPRS